MVKDSDPGEREGIYKVSRRIKRTEQTLYNALRSIYEDSLFVAEIRHLWPELPLMANLRCGLWYSSQFDGTCYFKSTDGHNGNWSFNTGRLNLHIATLAAERRGCFIVDATRKGKRFPDSMSKTIPIWACVLNRALADSRPCRAQEIQQTVSVDVEETGVSGDVSLETMGVEATEDWDCSLHLPIWVSHVEKANIESRIQGWVESLKSTSADLTSIAKLLKKPLRPLWVSQKTVIWLNEIPELDDWPFTPIILVSASRPSLFTERFTDAEFSWSYIPGAADDEESWARNLTPALFWKHSVEILDCGPTSCNAKIAEIVERDRVYRAVRGNYAPQARAKAQTKALIDPNEEATASLSSFSLRAVSDAHFLQVVDKHDGGTVHFAESRTAPIHQRSPEVRVDYGMGSTEDGTVRLQAGAVVLPLNLKEPPGDMSGFHWIGNTGLAVGNAACGNRDCIFEVVDCVINCGTSSSLTSSCQKDSYLYLPIVGPKIDRYSLQNHLVEALLFAKEQLKCRRTILIYCSNGEDISVCVSLAVLLYCFNAEGVFEDKPATTSGLVKKSDVRRRLIYVSSFNSDARPSRGSLRQVYNYFNANESRESMADHD